MAVRKSKPQDKNKTSKRIGKHPGGRPTKYRIEYVDKMIAHFDIPLYYYEKEEKMSASGSVMEVKVKRAQSMPTFESFAHEIDVIHETLRDWSKIHKEFSAAYNKCKGLQKKFLVHHGVIGNYNAHFAKFIAINCTDLVDRSEVKTENEHTHKGYGLSFNLEEKPE